MQGMGNCFFLLIKSDWSTNPNVKSHPAFLRDALPPSFGELPNIRDTNPTQIALYAVCSHRRQIGDM